jgi:hypothetical protein
MLVSLDSRTRETKNREREREFVFHMSLLDEKAIECTVVEKKKHNELLSKYMCEDLMEE